jgi:hypothetical protein
MSSVIFIDFENVQKINKEHLTENADVVILVGKGQEEKASDYEKKILNQVSSVKLIRVKERTQKGDQALDMFIFFYVGVYFEHIMTRQVKIYIYTKDKGYEPLKKHLASKGVSIEITNVREEKDVSSEVVKAPVNTPKKTATAKPAAVKVVTVKQTKASIVSVEEHYKKVIERLKKMKKAKPAKLETLKKQIKNIDSKQPLPDDDVMEVVEMMKKNGNIKVANDAKNKVTYPNL